MAIVGIVAMCNVVTNRCSASEKHSKGLLVCSCGEGRERQGIGGGKTCLGDRQKEEGIASLV